MFCLIVLENPKRRISDVKSSVALGVFDGLHLGHLELIKEVSSHSGLNHVIFSLKLSSRMKIKNHSNLSITSREQKQKILKDLGIDIFVLQDFDEDFSSLEPEHFFNKYIVEILNTGTLTVGFNYRFCKNAVGDTRLLSKLCEKNNIALNVVEAFKIGDQVVSSSSIKNFILSGDLDSAARFMGRPFSVMSEVVSGRRQGRLLGFPTANLKMYDDMLLPPDGVYITKAYIDGKSFDSMTNIGVKPTFDNYIRTVEVNILNFSGDIYGEMLEVQFYKHLRGIERFVSIEDLKNRLSCDRNEVIKYFSKEGE